MPRIPVKPIPDEDKVFRNIHPTLVQNNGRIAAGAYHDSRTPKKLCVVWQRHCQEPSNARIRMHDPSAYGVYSLIAGRVREIDEFDVVHSPSEYSETDTPVIIAVKNSHSLITGSDEETAWKLRDIAEEEIPVPPRKTA